MTRLGGDRYVIGEDRFVADDFRWSIYRDGIRNENAHPILAGIFSLAGSVARAAVDGVGREIDAFHAAERVSYGAELMAPVTDAWSRFTGRGHA